MMFLNAKMHRSIQKEQKKIVKDLVMDKLLKGHLGDTIDTVVFAGGSSELTAVPVLSDYDLECYIRAPDIASEKVENCGIKEWRKIRGGPDIYRDGSYMSIKKVREHVYAELKESVPILSKGKRYKIEMEFDRGSAAIKLVIKYGSAADINVDLVIGVRACLPGMKDKLNVMYLIGKPYSRENPDQHIDLWRISTSVLEKELFESQRRDHSVDKSRVYRIMKLVKKAPGNEVLDIFPSYFYKQVYMNLAMSYEDKPLHDRFKEFIQHLVKALDKHQLIILLNPDHPNMMDRWTPAEVKPALKFLNGFVQSGNYFKLLEPISNLKL